LSCTAEGKPTRQGAKAPLSVRSLKEYELILCAVYVFYHFFAEQISGKYLFIVRDK